MNKTKDYLDDQENAIWVPCDSWNQYNRAMIWIRNQGDNITVRNRGMLGWEYVIFKSQEDKLAFILASL